MPQTGLYLSAYINDRPKISPPGSGSPRRWMLGCSKVGRGYFCTVGLILGTTWLTAQAMIEEEV